MHPTPPLTHHVPHPVVALDELTHGHSRVLGLIAPVVTDGGHDVGGDTHLVFWQQHKRCNMRSGKVMSIGIRQVRAY
jgi:hypothetical protein